MCQFRDDDDCMFYFAYEYNSDIVLAQRTKGEYNSDIVLAQRTKGEYNSDIVLAQQTKVEYNSDIVHQQWHNLHGWTQWGSWSSE